jgi:hypothetical protein
MSWLTKFDDAVARENGVAVMPVRVDGVHAVGAMRIGTERKILELRSQRLIGVMCQTLVTVLDFLEEDDVGVDRLQGLPHVVNARPTANAGDAFVDVVGGDSDIHGRARQMPVCKGVKAGARSSNR